MGHLFIVVPGSVGWYRHYDNVRKQWHAWSFTRYNGRSLSTSEPFAIFSFKKPVALNDSVERQKEQGNI